MNKILCVLRGLCGERILEFTAELHGDARSGSYMRSCDGSLLASHAAAHCFEFQADILGDFNRAPHGLADKRRHFDSALLHVEHDRAGDRQLRSDTAFGVRRFRRQS